MKKGRVAIYSNAWDANAGGGIVYVLSTAKILDDNNFKVVVFFNESMDLQQLNERYECGNLKIKKVKKFNMPIFGQILFAIKELLNFDMVIQQALITPRITFINKSFLLCDFPLEKIQSFKKKLQLSSWKHIIANSEFTKKWINNYWNRSSLVLYPPVNCYKGDFNIKKKSIVCIGRFNEGLRSKRQDIVIEVFNELIKKGYSDLELHCIGFNQSNTYVTKCKIIAGNSPVHFHFNISNEEKIELLNNAAFFVSACGYNVDEMSNPHLMEHYGISVVEAKAFGCVPLVIGKGGHKETVVDGKSGFYWDSKKELFNHFVELISDDELVSKMRNESFNSFNNFSNSEFEKNIKKILN